MRKGESSMKKLILFGDSIMKGVTFNGSGYHLCPDHDLPQLAARTMPEFAPITLCLSWSAGNENPALSLFLEHWNRSCADPARK